MAIDDKASLFERIGGEQAVMAAVDVFYDKVLADPVTRPFFDEVDMAAQSRKQMAFMTWAFGGPAEYRGRDLRTAHAHLVRDKGLADVHFDAVGRHLHATLVELGVGKTEIDEVMASISSLRSEVLDR